MPDIRRYIAVFVGDDLVEAIDIDANEFLLIRERLWVGIDVDCYDCYPLTGDLLVFVRELLGDRLPDIGDESLLEATER